MAYYQRTLNSQIEAIFFLNLIWLLLIKFLGVYLECNQVLIYSYEKKEKYYHVMH